MVTVRVEISRIFGGFWWRRRSGWYGRFVDSAGYLIAIDLVAALGFACVLAVLGYAAFDRSLATVAGSVVAVTAYLLALAFLTSFGASVTQAATHATAPAELLARCKKLLEQHDFGLRGEIPQGILAARGIKAGAESNWRSFPLEVRATVAPADGAATLSVRCTGESGRHRFNRGLILRTAEAAANMDHASLEGLDRTLVMRPGALFQGGLGSMIFISMLVCAVLGTAILVGVSHLLATYVLDITQASAAADELRRMQVQLTAEIDAALRAEADRLAGEVEKSASKGGAPGNVLRSLSPSNVPGELIAGVVEPQGKVSLLHPPGAQWAQGVLNRVRRFGLARLGDKVLRELPQPQARDLEAQLGLKAGQLMIGASLTHADLARLAPERMESGSLEITFFDSSRPFLRYAWRPGKGLQVDAGSGALPADVLANAARRLEADWTVIFKDVLFGGDLGAVAIRMETRDGAPHRLHYSVARKEGGTDEWDGVSVARSYDPALETRESILPLAIALALIALLPVLVLTVALASFISNRISRPALQVRDALRSIGEGDYSVRIEPARRDEIGQMQAQLNKTAEELALRENARKEGE